MGSPRAWIAVVAAVASAAVLIVAVQPATASDPACTRVAAPGGSDSAPGTETEPFATAQKLVDALSPGDVGCLRQGTYAENVTVGQGGTGDDARVVIRSFPGERATISG